MSTVPVRALVTHDLSHAVNAALFRHLCGLDAFGMDEEAEAKVARLDRLLDAGGDDAVPVGLWHPERNPPLPAPAVEPGLAPS